METAKQDDHVLEIQDGFIDVRILFNKIDSKIETSKEDQNG